MRIDRKSVGKGLRRLAYLAGNFASYYTPDFAYRAFMRLRFALISKGQKRRGMERVDAYVRLDPATAPAGPFATSVEQFKFPYGQKHKLTAYFFDLYQAMRLIPKQLRFNYLFGDVSWETPAPTLVKSRPIPAPGAYSNCALARLNRLRHFRFVRDRQPWREKKDALVFRNIVRNQPHRSLFLDVASKIAMCDAGQVNTDCGNPSQVKPYLTIDEQLGYKFIACIEGNDVATNLKWVMSSNSIAVMPKPKMESWFLESRLRGGVHYIEVRDDYSDLEEKLRYYIAHPEEAEAIIGNAHAYASQFCNAALEKWIHVQTVKRYFQSTNQLP